jgi:hypothetical protein
MKEIEQAILGLHRDNKPNSEQTSNTNTTQPNTSQVQQPSEPFARVNAVAPDSPAKEAVSDIICMGMASNRCKKLADIYVVSIGVDQGRSYYPVRISSCWKSPHVASFK